MTDTESRICIMMKRRIAIPCLLLIGEGHKDGFVIDTEGYDYARYIAHIPNAEQLAIAVQYPNLENAVIETAFAADRIVREAIDSGSKEYSFNTDEERNRFRGAGFSKELLYTALKDKPEIESIDFDGDYMLCTVKDEYMQQADGRRALTQEEADVMLAKHTLWLNDAGGIQADFSNCFVQGLNLAHKNMMNAVMIECKMEYGSFQNCCTDGTNFCGLDDCTEINMRGCNSDREDWRREGFDPELIM